MIIGRFTYDAEAKTYQGGILSLNFGIVLVRFIPNNKNGDKEPDYRVVAPTENGPVELGAGWKRSSEQGTDFISVSLDGPMLPEPINAALFTDEDLKAALVWTRSKPKAAADTPAKPKVKKAA